MGNVKHFAKPTKGTILRLCTYPRFKERVDQLRAKWGIDTLANSPDEAHRFWQNLCEAGRQEPDYEQRWYEGRTPDREFKRELQELCQDFGLVTDMWITLYHVVLCLDLDNVGEADIQNLPVDPTLFRINMVEYDPAQFHRFQKHHLYLDVTYATRKDDVAEIWKEVEYWQKHRRPAYIEQGMLPDFLQDITPGRPSKPKDLDDDTCLECLELKRQGFFNYQIGQMKGWPLERTETGLRCRMAEFAIKRAKQLEAAASNNCE